MKNSYKKAYSVLALIILIAFVLLYKVLEVKDANMDDIRKGILETADITTMSEGDELKLRKLYYINKNDIEDFILYAPKTNMDASEILVLKAKSENDIDELKSKVEDRIEKQSNSFQSYRPEEYEVINNEILEVNGKYLVLIISEDSRNIKKAIDKDFK